MRAIFSGLFTAALIFFPDFRPVWAAPTVTSPTALATSQVVTAGTAVTAIAAGTVYNGCYITNDPASVTNIVVDPVATANFATPSSTAVILTPNQTWECPGASQTAVTVNSGDNAHKFYGAKY